MHKNHFFVGAWVNPDERIERIWELVKTQRTSVWCSALIHRISPAIEFYCIYMLTFDIATSVVKAGTSPSRLGCSDVVYIIARL